MTAEELAKIDPRVVRSVTHALRSTIDYYKQGRGALLRSLRLDPQVAAIVQKLRAE